MSLMSVFGAYKLVVVGAGFFGVTIAHRAATELDIPVLVLDKRNHIGGNCYSEIDSKTGIEYHKYGTHIFHTSSEEVWAFVNRFCQLNNYRHRVFTRYNKRTFTMPINLMTINQFFGLDLDPEDARKFIAEQAAAEGIKCPQNLEEKAVTLIGRRLYEAFVKGYTVKQWQTDPRELPADIINRLPVRFSYNDFYFTDHFEGIPIGGYTSIFRNMLAHTRIHVIPGCDFFEVQGQLDPKSLVVFTGPIDRYFEYRFGELGWRTLDFEIERLPIDDYQGAAVINYPEADERFARIHEFKHLHPERRHRENSTLIMREYSRFARHNDEPYYPIGVRKDKDLYEEYRALADREPNTIFGGRLGSYRYLDMHQAIGGALKCFDNEVVPRLNACDAV